MPLQRGLDNRYEVLSSLGRGGMAEVYLARDRVLDREVALKLLSRRYAEDGEFVRRFRREARSAASLVHPNVVSVHDFGEAEGGVGEPPTYYIAMEYVEGVSLQVLLEREVRLPWQTAVAIARQVAEGLRAAHGRGIVHRDIKPHNILLSGPAHDGYPGEGLGEVKVADFGIARAAASTMTETGGVLGTAHYLSPEQAMGGDTAPRSDLYSLGVVMYEMLTGRRPYDGNSPFGVAMQHVTGDLRPPKKVIGGLPEGLNSTVVRLLGKDPEERHRDADELLADLDALRLPRSEEPVAAPGGSLGRRAVVPICFVALLAASLWATQGSNLSALTGSVTGEVRSGVEALMRDQNGPEGPRVDIPAPGEDGPAPEEPASGGETEPERSEPREKEERDGGEPEEPAPAETVPGEPSAGGSTAGEASPEESAPGRGGADDDRAPGNAPPTTGEGSEEALYVPDIAGQPLELAIDTVESTGFRVTGVVEEPSQSAAGTVLYTDPAAGATGEPGDGVALSVSAGPPGAESPGETEPPGGSGDGQPGGDGGSDDEGEVIVPDVIGRQSEQAVLVLESAGLSTEVRGAFGSGGSGAVASTDPPAGSRVEEGALITLTVTGGTRPAAAPSDEPPPDDQYGDGQYAE